MMQDTTQASVLTVTAWRLAGAIFNHSGYTDHLHAIAATRRLVTTPGNVPNCHSPQQTMANSNLNCH
jgi:hypothetical protein